MRTIHIAASREYDVHIGSGLLDELGSRAADMLRGRNAVIVTDSNVAPLYLDRALSSMRAAGFNAEGYVIPAGEASKCGTTYLNLVNFLAERHLTRTDGLVALGGGVVGDLTGFAAATYLRGVGLIQVPTTLLACVDSSVGGKTAIDLPAGKNLCGAFYQPWLVLCDPETIESLPDSVLSDGCAEVIKYGMLGDGDLLRRLQEVHIRDQLEAVIARCVEMKRDVVEGDEFDTGRRQLLNLGHTFAHSIEKLSDYTIPHGSAVAVGMQIITRAALKKGLCPQECLDTLEVLLKKYSLPTETQYSPEQLAEVALSDKKRKGDTLTLVVPCAWGESALRPVPVNELADWARAGLDA
ncbi:MAG: 3-dehydroquinate synthase [Aristaeellaceae bacterium]